IRVVHGFRRRAVADLEVDRRGRATVDQMMTIFATGWKPGCDPRLETLLAGFRHQRDVALQHVDELVLVRMPVPQRRPRAGRQLHEVDAEMAEPERVAQGPLATRFAGTGQRRRVSRPLTRRKSCRIDGGWLEVARHG